MLGDPYIHKQKEDSVNAYFVLIVFFSCLSCSGRYGSVVLKLCYESMRIDF